ncbi:uncharacterized protein LOC126675443 [Mercurialis annua]|uniref:uncharacterized protein LOC126675443 n=1 Tax=Mercurialis annua TaxID=3986 RepID=UPI00215FF0D5|nr:uncharacterized protein LOC126675443 [Mercurialis annua]
MEENIKFHMKSSITPANPILKIKKQRNKSTSKIDVSFRVRKTHHICDILPSDERADSTMSYIRETHTWHPSTFDFSISCDGSKLTDEEHHKQQVLDFLMCRAIHDEEYLQRILTAVWAKIKKVALRTTSKTCGNLFVGVDVVKWERYDEDAFMRAAMESMEDDTDRKVPASESSIAGLERFVFDDENLEEKKCVICLEEMEMGMEAIRMPCSHFYHQDCILQWLHKSHLCPLCRYKMPVEE